MTFYHFINCVLLTFAPLVLLYKFTPLSEYGSVWRCGGALCGYLLTQMGKLLVIASIMTPTAMWDNLIDCCGLYYFLVKQQKASLAQVKILSVALGWSLGESLLTRLIDFYMNARSMQFDWKHILNAGESNVFLLQNICVCSLLWQWNRTGQKLSFLILLAYFATVNFVAVNLLWKGGATLALAVTTLFIVS